MEKVINVVKAKVEKNLSYNSMIPSGQYKGSKVKTVIAAYGKAGVLELIQEGYPLSDDILAQFNIVRRIHDSKPENEVVSDKPEMTETDHVDIMNPKEILNDYEDLVLGASDYLDALENVEQMLRLSA